jgi:hypothetical protein
MSWIIEAHEDNRRSRLVIEGSARSRKHGVVNQFTLAVGSDFAVLDVVSPWTSSLAFYHELGKILGPSRTGLNPLAIGELMDAAHEGHATAVWEFGKMEKGAVLDSLRELFGLKPVPEQRG